MHTALEPLATAKSKYIEYLKKSKQQQLRTFQNKLENSVYIRNYARQLIHLHLCVPAVVKHDVGPVLPHFTCG